MVNCCVVRGCRTNSKACPSLTFFKIARVDKAHEANLIQAVNRPDINVNQGAICSRHFEESCLLKKGITGWKFKLKPGSLPTKYMAPGSVERKAVYTKSSVSCVNDTLAESLIVVEPRTTTIEEVIDAITSEISEDWHILTLTEGLEYDVIQYSEMNIPKCMQVRRGNGGVKCTLFVSSVQLSETTITEEQEAVALLRQLKGTIPCLIKSTVHEGPQPIIQPRIDPQLLLKSLISSETIKPLETQESEEKFGICL